MELNKHIGKFAMWALLFQDYDFEVVHCASVINLDANGHSRNSNPLDEDLIGAKWHGDFDREAVWGWDTTSYFTLFFEFATKVPIQSLHDETDHVSYCNLNLLRIYEGSSHIA